MSLLREIQEAAVSETTDITTLLRKCRILASRLKHDDLKKWVQCEIDGYPTCNNLPEYRIKFCESFGNFSGPFGTMMNNAQIPMFAIPDKYREAMSKAYFTEGVSQLQHLVSDTNSDNPIQPWPTDIYPLVGQQIYEGWNMLRAWKRIPTNSIVGILDSVRNKVLNFALEIESANPDAGEAAPNTQAPVPDAIVQHIFNTYISGNVGNMANASSHSHLNATITVCKEDFKSLSSYLASVGVAPADIETLKDAVQHDGPPQNGCFGNRVGGWIGGMVSKAAQGVLKIGVEVSSNVLTQSLKSYYGLP